MCSCSPTFKLLAPLLRAGVYVQGTWVYDCMHTKGLWGVSQPTSHISNQILYQSFSLRRLFTPASSRCSPRSDKPSRFQKQYRVIVIRIEDGADVSVQRFRFRWGTSGFFRFHRKHFGEEFLRFAASVLSYLSWVVRPHLFQLIQLNIINYYIIFYIIYILILLFVNSRPLVSTVKSMRCNTLGASIFNRARSLRMAYPSLPSYSLRAGVHPYQSSWT